MFNLFIQGLSDGEHEINMQVPVSDIPEMFEEYFGQINLKGRLKKIGNRFTLFSEADCQAKMICDISLEEFTELIKVEVNLTFIADSKQENRETSKDKDYIYGVKVSADGKYADISGEIREIFAVSLPMKRIAPPFRGKDFKEIHPEYDPEISGSGPKKIDERWAPLAKINSN